MVNRNRPIVARYVHNFRATAPSKHFITLFSTMGNVNGRSSKKGNEICERLDLKSDKSVCNSSTNGQARWKGKKLDQMDEEMIDQVYQVLKKAGKDGNQDVQFLRRYVKQQLKSSKKGKAVLDELGEDYADEVPKKIATNSKFRRSTTAVSA